MTPFDVWQSVQPLRSVIAILNAGLKHAVVGVAIVAILMAAFRVHIHAAEAHGHDHDHGVGITCGLGHIDDDAPQLPDPEDEDCGFCHCQSVPVMAAEPTSLTLHPTRNALTRHGHPWNVPDSLSYPPDPPPVRLS